MSYISMPYSFAVNSMDVMDSMNSIQLMHPPRNPHRLVMVHSFRSAGSATGTVVYVRQTSAKCRKARISPVYRKLKP